MAVFNNTGVTKTICWNCKNCVPSVEKKQGCEWSEHLKPVPGWDAVRHKLTVSTGRSVISYMVRSCPKFDQIFIK